MDRDIRQRLQSAITAVASIALSAIALAHDEGGPPDPKLAESVAPGITAIGVLAAAAIIAAVWLRMRRLAMLRALKLEVEGSAGPTSSERDARS